MTPFTTSIIAAAADIDELGHVNNAVWVRWIQEVSVAHWRAIAAPEQVENYYWVIVRHEIDYRSNVFEGEAVTVETWVADAPKGARFDRYMRFTGADGRVKVEATTTWAIVDKASGRIVRVPAEVTARFTR